MEYQLQKKNSVYQMENLVNTEPYKFLIPDT